MSLSLQSKMDFENSVILQLDRNLGLGHLWRLAVDHPKQQVLPCIHSAPIENEGEYHLLLIY